MANSLFLFPAGGTVTGATTFSSTATFADGGTWSSTGIAVATASSIGWSTDALLVRDAAGTIAQRNGVNAQLFRVYNTTDASTTNYDRLLVGYISNNAVIDSAAGGSGTVRPLLLRINGNTVVAFNALGTTATFQTAALFSSDNSLDIGASNATRPRTIYYGTSVVAGGYNVGARSTVQSYLSVTTAVSVSGASTGTGNVIPAGATVTGVATTTTTTITGASGYQVGDGTTAARWGDITGTAVGTVSGSANYTTDPRWWTTAARAITLTAKTSNFTGGVVQVTVFYRTETGV